MTVVFAIMLVVHGLIHIALPDGTEPGGDYIELAFDDVQYNVRSR